MNLSQLRSRCKPHLWFQLYWVVYLVWFFWLDLTIKDPKYIIYSPLDDSIPFNEWFVFPYCSWFCCWRGHGAAVVVRHRQLRQALPEHVCGHDLLSDRLHGAAQRLDIRPTAEAVGRSNIAMRIMQLLWSADASVNVCPSIHCQSSACMALAFSSSTLTEKRPGLKVLAWCGPRSSVRPRCSPSSTPSWMWCAALPWPLSGCRCCTVRIGKQLRKEPAKTSGFP